MPVDYSDILNGYNLHSRLSQPLHCGDSRCIEAIYSQPDSSNAKATQSLTHVQSSHLSSHIGPLLCIQEPMLGGSSAPNGSSISISKDYN